MPHYHALRHLKENQQFKANDVLVLFGELFSLGYANGLLEEATKRGLKVIYATVGRRERDNSLRPLLSEELQSSPQPLINVPLEAGFDLETDANGNSVVDLLKNVKLTDWEEFKFEKDFLREMQKQGRTRFQNHLRTYLKELERHIPEEANVLFAHLMAGGVPRAKIVMPLMNRVFKGKGERHISSEKFWQSSIGRLCSESFYEVTAETFNQLIIESQGLREKIEKRGNKVAYLAYGYHGTEVLLNSQYTWQTYTPYVQGWAKMRLEQYSQEWSKKGVQTCVYNCPEILTHSSSIFQGVELSLYPLIEAIRNDCTDQKKKKEILDSCADLLKPEYSLQKIHEIISAYFHNKVIRAHCDFEKWPQHNHQDQMELMLNTSDQIYDLHRDQKNIITYVLSKVVFTGCGKVMLNDIGKPESPVAWINHDVLAKVTS